MSTVRLAGIPISHVLAEVAAYPVASESTLRSAVTHLDPCPRAGHACEVWRSAEHELLGGFPSFSIDEVVAARDHIWFGRPLATDYSLAAYLRRLAGEFLEVRGNTAVPSIRGWNRNEDGDGTGPGPRAAQTRRTWRWISFALPPDLLLAALSACGGTGVGRAGSADLGRLQEMPGEVDAMMPALDRHLADRGFAETHCHIGAAIDFPLLWVSCLRTLASPDLKSDAFGSPGAGLDEGRDLGGWLIRAAIVRYVLAAFLDVLHARSRAAGDFHFQSFLEDHVPGCLIEGRRASPGRQGWDAPDYKLLLTALGDLRRGELTRAGMHHEEGTTRFCPRTGRAIGVGFGASFAEWQSLYARLTGVLAVPFPERLRDVQRADPISGLFPASGRRRPTPEMRFVAASLAYLEGHPDDRAFATAFWQAVRVRTLYYRHVVQRPMTPGLQWFIRFYGRLSPGRRPVTTALRFEAAREVGGIDRGLRSLEVRTSPEATYTQMLESIRDFDQSVREALRSESSARRCEYGLVLHFTKDRGGGAQQGSPSPFGLESFADPGSPAFRDVTGGSPGYRYTRYYAAKRDEALAFAWILRSFPLSLRVLRGIDVCTDELGVPNWVLGPLIDHVRRAGYIASRSLEKDLGIEVPPLYSTVHVGEDFVHLLSGLRRVDEALHHFKLREGDRIGHGIALGTDPRSWSQRVGLIPMSREERLLDLVWEWNWYGRSGDDPPSGRLHAVERDIFRLAQQVFPHAPTEVHHRLNRMVDDLHDAEMLRAVGFPHGPTRPPPGAEERELLLFDYLTVPEVFHRGCEIEWLDPATEGEALAVIQAGLRRRVADRGVTVEVNPSSNLLIGDLQDLTMHPFWRLQPPRPTPESSPVSVCIGSDDPVTFATELRREYQLVYDALVLAGLSEVEARRWVDRVRKRGLESRFTLHRDCEWHRPLTSYVNAEPDDGLRPP